MSCDGMHQESASEYARDNQEKRDESECDFPVPTVEAPRATGAVTSVPSSPKPLSDKADMLSDIELQTWHISEGQALNVIVALVETHAAAATDTESSPVREFLVGAYNEDCSDSRAGQAEAQLTTECDRLRRELQGLRSERAIQKCRQCFEEFDGNLKTLATNARDKWCVDPTTGEVSRPLGWTESMVKDGDYSDQYYTTDSGSSASSPGGSWLSTPTSHQPQTTILGQIPFPSPSVISDLTYQNVPIAVFFFQAQRPVTFHPTIITVGFGFPPMSEREPSSTEPST